GAEGVQIGTLFAVSRESSASEAFKQLCVALGEDGTMLALKKISPTRLIKNELYAKIAEAESRGAEAEELRQLLGRAASKRGIFEGDLTNGELEIGQIVGAIREVKPVAEIMDDIITDFEETKRRLAEI
ncbi:MAG: nitronate monooxygenase, partial [Bacteroidales bacterium]|nr:nitronate monooxygenase [Bacteroidales bacterium]